MSKSTMVLIAVIAVGGAWLGWDALRRPAPESPREMSGMEFVIPPEYQRLELGPSDYAAAAGALLTALAGEDPVAAVFTQSGARVHLLAHPGKDGIEEHVMAPSGVLRKVLWPGSVQDRLQWASEHGDLEAPAMEPPYDRNAYH